MRDRVDRQQKAIRLLHQPACLLCVWVVGDSRFLRVQAVPKKGVCRLQRDAHGLLILESDKNGLSGWLAGNWCL